MLFCTIIFNFCFSQNKLNDTIIVNNILNEQYFNSNKLFKGKLEVKEYNEVRKLIENELNTNIPEGKDILINYFQKAPNCLQINYDLGKTLEIIDNTISISSKLCKQNNAIDFFIFTNDTPLNQLYRKNQDFKEDTGFFYNTIFTLHENCCGFFLLKSNGKFYKYYGSDYFTLLNKYL